MKTTALLSLLLFAAGLAHAETIDFQIEGQHPAYQMFFEGSGSITVPNGTVVANLSNLQAFHFTLYDIQGSTNPIYAYATYNMDASDLVQFSATFDSAGDPEQISLQTLKMDPNPANIQSSLIADWTPTLLQPDGNVGGIAVDFIVDPISTATAPEPGYAVATGLLLVFLGIFRLRSLSKIFSSSKPNRIFEN